MDAQAQSLGDFLAGVTIAFASHEDGAVKQGDQDRDAAGKVKTLSAMSAIRMLDPGIIRDLLEANNASLHLTMEAHKSLTAES